MTTAAPTPRRGLFARIRGWFTRPVLTPADTVVLEYRTGDPIVVPADGGVFTFTVEYDLTWSARGVWAETLRERVDRYHDSAVRALRTAIWPISRATEPHRPEDAERAMNEALRDGWCYGEETGELVACRASVRVLADGRVLDRHLPLWERLVELDLRYRVEHRRIDHLVDLLERWRDVLAEFGSTPLVVQAATLTDTDLAAALDGLADRQLALGTDLVSVLEKARNGHGRIGMFELAESYDLAARTFARQAGVREDVLAAAEEAGAA
ncbi:MAG TPA: hypothetical protein VHH15_14160 [Actinophytocola sp.]|nr:hypothetical protein [Actinophytocola sp.]